MNEFTKYLNKRIMKRKSGYYWVRFSEGWFILLYEQERDLWFYCGVGGSITDAIFKEIDERKIIKP